MTASNDVGSQQSSITITTVDSFQCISVNDDASIGTPAGQSKQFDVHIDSIGTDSCLAIDYGEGTLLFYGHQPTCMDHPLYDDTKWSALTIPISPFEIHHTYDENGSYKLTFTGFNLVSEVVREFPFAITGLSCTVPQLIIEDAHPYVDFPRTFFKRDPVILEVITKINCEVHNNDKRWKIELLDPETKEVQASYYLDDSNNPEPFYIPGAATSIRFPSRVLGLGLYKATFEMTIDPVDTGGVALTNSITEYIQVASSPLIIRCFKGQTTSIVIGHGETVDMNPEENSEDPNMPADVDQVCRNRTQHNCLQN